MTDKAEPQPLSSAPSGLGLNLALYLLQKTQFIVTLLTTIALLRIRTAHSLWFGVGTLVAMLSAKFLKLFIRQPRPSGAKKFEKTYGMPSTHSSSIAFFGTYLSLSSLLLPLHPRVTSLLPFWDYILSKSTLHTDVVIWSHVATWAQTITRVVLALMWVGGAAAVCWSRVRLGHHTPAQVVAGATLGSTVALFWMSVWLGLSKFPFGEVVVGSGWVPSVWANGISKQGLRWQGVAEEVGTRVWEAWKDGQLKDKLPGVIRNAIGEL